MKRPVLAALGLTIVASCVTAITLGLLSVKHALTHAHPSHVHAPLPPGQAATLRAAIAIMRERHLNADAALAATLLRQAKWQAAAPDDFYLTQAERGGDTPYAYTLADGKTIIGVFLAPRFFTEVTPPARAALMIHELGHVRAYLQTGRSDEFDGYKHEYDANAKLGLTERDGLPYFAMLDGVTQYVLPRAPEYRNRADIRAYLAQSNQM